MSNHSFAASGGSGSGYHARIIIRQAGFYTIGCGTGGVSYGFARAAVGAGGAGGASYLRRNSDNVTIVNAGGGGAGSASSTTSATAGAAGVLTKNIEEQTVYVSTNGTRGNMQLAENHPIAAGVAGPISGKSWGRTQEVRGGPSGAGDHIIGASYHGFVWLKYVDAVPVDYTFTINPTPSDATVQLTINGTTYTQSSIEVIGGTTVSWSVSKAGYTTQTGSVVITEDTTQSVVLEEQQNPLYYCYVANGGSPGTIIFYSSEIINTTGTHTVRTTSQAGVYATTSSDLVNSGNINVSGIIQNGFTAPFVESTLSFYRTPDKDLYT